MSQWWVPALPPGRLLLAASKVAERPGSQGWKGTCKEKPAKCQGPFTVLPSLILLHYEKHLAPPPLPIHSHTDAQELK